MRVIGGDGAAHAAQSRTIFRIKIARFFGERRAFLHVFFARRARVRRKIYRKHARFSSHKFLIIAGDGPAHAAQARKIFRAKITRSSWRTPTERAHFCVCFACGARAFDEIFEENMRECR